jgi:hypothetical protein
VNHNGRQNKASYNLLMKSSIVADKNYKVTKQQVSFKSPEKYQKNIHENVFEKQFYLSLQADFLFADIQ